MTTPGNYCNNYYLISQVYTPHIQAIYIYRFHGVVSLYPNIDHEEGISACEEALNKRSSQYVPTFVLSDFIKTVLQCNTLEFNGKYYHQIKGTAMGTPMAVNFANIFMSKFEKHMIRDFLELYGKNHVILNDVSYAPL